MNENDIEQLAIAWIQSLGYTYINGADLKPDNHNAQRNQYEQVLLMQTLQMALAKINAHLPASALEQGIKELQRIASPDLLANNKQFHTLLTEGIPITKRVNGENRGDRLALIDFDNIANNTFHIVNQFTIKEQTYTRRPDLIVFVNGLPLIVIELKNPTKANTSIQAAFRQIETYKTELPTLFKYNAFCIISDGLDARLGTISAGIQRYMEWKIPIEKAIAQTSFESLIKGVLQPFVLLDLVRHFTIFEQHRKIDAQGLTTIQIIKKIAAYHQYYAVNKALESTKTAAGFTAAESTRKAGVVWHTQGSGKSLSMVFYTGKVVLALNNPTVLVITDRNDLDDQLFDTFAACKALLRQDPVQALDRAHLKELLKVNAGGIVFTTIQKFQPQEGNVYETLSTRQNIIVLADEAHRTQYGFAAKTVDDKDEKGNIIGKKVVYGFAKYMRDALPNATYLGFTGTPIESTDINTPAVFGDYIDVYDLKQAVDDGATVPIYYESRLAKIELTEEGKALVKDLDEELEAADLSQTQKAKSRWTQLEAIIGGTSRLKNIAKDIVMHFTQRTETLVGKGMIVAMSRRIAAALYNEIIALQPHWHSDDLTKGKIKVVMTAAASDGPDLAKFHTTKEQRRALAERMKDPNDELELVIVRDMWLTGFDAPCMHTLYIDKPMKGHNLMQAIARVNRVYKDKSGGLIVDYLGIASDLKAALSFYTESGGKGDPALAQEEAVAIMIEKIEVIDQMFFGFDYKVYFQANTAEKLQLILAAENHILGIEEGKKRFIDNVTALSKAFSIAIPHDKAIDAKDIVAFFQAIKARLQKFNASPNGKTDEEIETAIRQVIDKALVSNQVIDIFDAAGIKKPDISIFSDEFMLEVKNMKHKNIALELLKKLLNDEIKARSKMNIMQSQSLMDMLKEALNKYQNKHITNVEVIEELLELSKRMLALDEEFKNLKLTEYEYAFYTAVRNKGSYDEFIAHKDLLELSKALTNTVKENATIDWDKKESVRAKLRVMIKKLLVKYRYPPDLAKLAVDNVLKQAELLATELTQQNQKMAALA